MNYVYITLHAFYGVQIHTHFIICRQGQVQPFQEENMAAELEEYPPPDDDGLRSHDTTEN